MKLYVPQMLQLYRDAAGLNAPDKIILRPALCGTSSPASATKPTVLPNGHVHGKSTFRESRIFGNMSSIDQKYHQVRIINARVEIYGYSGVELSW